MANASIDKIVEACERAREREARAGNQVFALLYRNEAWQRENGNWMDWIKLESENA
jgi:hypothetical protein